MATAEAIDEWAERDHSKAARTGVGDKMLHQCAACAASAQGFRHAGMIRDPHSRRHDRKGQLGFCIAVTKDIAAPGAVDLGFDLEFFK